MSRVYLKSNDYSITAEKSNFSWHKARFGIIDFLILKGDGIGSEIVDEAVKVLKKVEQKFSYEFNLIYADFGGASIDKYGLLLTDKTIEIAFYSMLLAAINWRILNNQNVQKWATQT